MPTMHENTQHPQRANKPAVALSPHEAEIRKLAEDVVRYCPSLTHLLLALGSKGRPNPLQNLN